MKTRGLARMKVLAVDVGGTHVKILATGQNDKREFASGAQLTAARMVETTVSRGCPFMCSRPIPMVLTSSRVLPSFR